MKLYRFLIILTLFFTFSCSVIPKPTYRVYIVNSCTKQDNEYVVVTRNLQTGKTIIFTAKKPYKKDEYIYITN